MAPKPRAKYRGRNRYYCFWVGGIGTCCNSWYFFLSTIMSKTEICLLIREHGVVLKLQFYNPVNPTHMNI